MKLDWNNKKYNTVAAYVLIIIAISVLFVVFVFKFDSFAKGFSWVGSVAAPIICGIVIAYILNPLVMLFENKVFAKLKNTPPPSKGIVMRKLEDSRVGDTIVVKELEKHSAKPEKKQRRRKTAARVLSIILTYVIVLAALTGMIVAIVPSVSASVVDLAGKMDGYVANLEKILEDLFKNNPDITKYITDEFNGLNDILNKIAEYLQPMAGGIIGDVSSGVFKALGAIFTGTKNILIGFVIAIYLLFSKERLLGQIKKIFFAFFRNDRCLRFFNACSRSNHIFKKYIISNLLDALIIFIVMAIGCLIMGMPYPMLIAVVCGVTNLIPFFGPFIGAIPCGLLILLVDPIKVIWFAIFVLILQQTDGNVIKPFLFGETIGLPAIWVLISIIVGGGLFGVAGMILGAPVFAVFYLLFADFISGKLKKKNLPDDTSSYTENIGDFTNDFVKNSDTGTSGAESKE